MQNREVTMQIRDCMKHSVISISSSATIGQAAARMSSRRIGMLPVVDQAGHLIGTLQMRGLLGLIMPDFVKIVEDFDFVHDFGALESQKPPAETMNRPIYEVMETPIYVQETCGLIRAFSLMHKHNLIDMPVINNEKILVGIASLVDIGAALLGQWRTSEEKKS